MKNMKKILTILLILSLSFGFSSTTTLLTNAVKEIKIQETKEVSKVNFNKVEMVLLYRNLELDYQVLVLSENLEKSNAWIEQKEAIAKNKSFKPFMMFDVWRQNLFFTYNKKDSKNFKYKEKLLFQEMRRC